MKIEYINNPTEQDIQVIYQGLRHFNRPYFPNEEIKKVTFLVKDDSQKHVGGITGELFSNTLYIKYLWLDEQCRKQGLGSKLISLIEEKALEKNVTDIYIDTYSFQAKDFYLKKDLPI